MANAEESNPLLSNQEEEEEEQMIAAEKKPVATAKPTAPPPEEAVKQPLPQPAVPMGWPAEGLPLSVMGEPMPMPLMNRAQWDSDLCACFGRNDEFCSSDLEVCLLGSMAPCVLYGSNVERLGYTPGTFSNHCFPYTALYLLGSSFFGWNCLAPWFSYPIRSAIRRKFNLEGSCESLARSFGCGTFMENEVQREQCESACDFATHVFCHACALCQEGREIRRRLPHPGFTAQPVVIMVPPSEQAMARGM